MSLFTRMRDAAEKRRRYNRTVAELQAVPRELAEDVGFFPEDAHDIAHKAVYGA